MINALLLAINMETLTKSLNILWQGILAMVVVIGVIMLVTYFMQYVATITKEEKQKLEEEYSSQNQTENKN